MKTLTTLIALSFLTAACFAQDKKEIKQLEKDYGVFSGHKGFYKNKEWAMCKFSIVFKLSTAMTAKAMDKNKEVGAKVKSSSGAYGMLNGITEKDLQDITDKVAQNFIKRLKDEAGIDISTWSEFKDSDNTEKLKEGAEEREIYSKSQGLAYAVSYDGTPHYFRVISLVPGGKKLAKELKKNVMEFTLYIDFADVLATAEADVSVTGRTSSTISYSWDENADQKLYPGVRLVPNLGSESLSEMGKNLGGTKISGHDQNGYMYYMGCYKDIVSDVQIAEKIEEHEGEVPEILANRRNNKIEYAKTFDVYTTPEKYSEAVMDVTNQYFDVFIKVYNYNAKK